MTNPNKPYGTTPRLDPSIQGPYPSLFICLYLTQFLTDFGQILDSKFYDQAKNCGPLKNKEIYKKFDN